MAKIKSGEISSTFKFSSYLQPPNPPKPPQLQNRITNSKKKNSRLESFPQPKRLASAIEDPPFN